MSLPLKQPLDLMQNSWKSQLDPVIACPMAGVNILTNVALIVGATVIPHKLGRKMQGYFITDLPAAAVIYRSSPFNDSTLTLTSDTAVIVNLGVF